MVYLIDSENVAGGWVPFAVEKHSQDSKVRFLVMYTDGTPRLTYDEAAAVVNCLGQSVVFSKCSKGRPNALDFRLVAQVGILAMNEPEEEYCIVSNDQGFDEAIHAYQAGGIHVSRQPCSNRLTVDPPAQVLRLPRQFAPETILTLPKPETVAVDELLPADAASIEAAAMQPQESAVSAEESSGQGEETREQTFDENRALHQKQRRFLSAYCSVPKIMAEAVRSALEKDQSRAEKTIRNSRSRAFGDDPAAKENAIRCIREHYEEYCALSVGSVQ